MRALFVRETLVVARKPALVSIVIFYCGVLALFLAAWGGHRVPVLAGSTIYDQQYLVQCALLLCILPWTAARVVATERADGLVRLSAILALPPSHVVIARLLAAAIASAVVVASALPVALVAQQMSAVPALRTVIDQCVLLTFALPAGVVAVWWMQVSRDRLLGWLGATASAMLLLAMVRFAFPSAAAAAAVSGLGAVVGAAVLITRADVWWRYLAEDAA